MWRNRTAQSICLMDPMALLLLLDSEVYPMMHRHLRDTLNGLLTTLAEQQLRSWLTLFKEVLTTSAYTTASPIQPPQQSSGGLKSGASTTEDDGDGATNDDDEEFHANGDSLSPTPSSRPGDVPPPRCHTRVLLLNQQGNSCWFYWLSPSAVHFDNLDSSFRHSLWIRPTRLISEIHFLTRFVERNNSAR